MEKTRSDAYAIVSLAFALFGILGAINFFLITARGNINIISRASSIIGLFTPPIIPLFFGIIGLKSSAKKAAKAAILISILEIIFKLFFLFVMPIIGIMLGGVG